MDKLSALISEIKDYDTEYGHYDDLIRIAYTIPDYEYKNIGILDAFKLEFLKHFNMGLFLEP